MTKIFLASKSSRRLDILRNLGFDVTILHSDYREILPSKHPSPEGLARFYAEEKLKNVREPKEPGFLITADTIVFLGEEIFGKPANESQARKMLSKLSGKTHKVVTAISLIKLITGERVTRSTVTRVTFDFLSPYDIDRYIEWGEWQDKAGAYGIQGRASLFIKEIKGCYFNVVGFPVNLFFRTINQMGFKFENSNHPKKNYRGSYEQKI